MQEEFDAKLRELADTATAELRAAHAAEIREMQEAMVRVEEGAAASAKAAEEKLLELGSY